MITNASWYVTNQTLNDDLKVPFIKDVIQEKSINHHDKLGNHSNPYVRFEVFTAVTMKNGVFWDVTPCGTCKNRRFRGT
jgi:hypothetical protein